MNFILFLKELWRRRIAVLIAALLAGVVAVVAVYSVSFAPPSLNKRDHTEAKGGIEILVDSTRSPIADVARNLEPLTARAGVFARYIAGGNVIDKISKRTGIPVKQIEVAGPAPLPGEAIGSSSPPANLRPYGIEIVQRDALPIVNVATRAPTVSEARDLAAATPGAIREIVSAIQERQQIPESKRVTFRVLGPAQAQLDREALGAKVAISIFLALFALGIVLIIGVPRLVKAWRSVDSEPPAQPRLETVPQIPQAPAEEPSTQSALQPAEAIAERAQLEMRRGGDG